MSAPSPVLNLIRQQSMREKKRLGLASGAQRVKEEKAQYARHRPDLEELDAVVLKGEEGKGIVMKFVNHN